MSVTINYKNDTLATFRKTTKTLTTKGKYLEDNISITDDTTNGAVYQDEDGYVVINDEDGSGLTLLPLNITENGTYQTNSLDAGYSPVTVNVKTDPTLQSKTVTPTESSQTVKPDTNYDGLSQVTVGAISNTYVGTGITKISASNLTHSGPTVTAPAGYYSSALTHTINNGSAVTPATTLTFAPAISINAATGKITATVSGSSNITPTVTAGYVSAGTAGKITVTGTASQTMTTRAAATITPTESVQTAVNSGVYTLGSVKVAAISSTYVGTGIARKSASDVTVTNSTVTTPAGYYPSAVAQTVKAGTAATPATTLTYAPAITIDAAGKITATVTGSSNVTPTISAGWVTTGTAGKITVSGSSTKQLTTQKAQTITPSTTDQTIKSLRYLTGDQTILGDANLVPQNIAEGVSIFGVQGSHSGAPKHTATITSDGYYDDRSGMKCSVYFNGTRYLTAGETFQFSSGDVADLIITPWDSTTTATNIYVDGVLVSSKVGWQAYAYTLPDNDINIELTTNCVRISITTIVYYNTSNADASPSDVAEGKTFYNAEGYHTGTASGNYGSVLKGIIERTTTNPTLPEDLTCIGDFAFYGFRSLALTSLPNGVTSIGRSAFYDCNNLALTSLPSGITSIGGYAFYSCYSLALTSLPSGITSIDSYTFYGCYNLALTSLPSGVVAIGDYAFEQCINITSISCDGAIGSLRTGAFRGVYSHPMRLAHVSFPNMQISALYTVFGDSSASSACQQLEDADIGSTQSIASNAFANCYKLQTLVLRRSDAICTLANVSAFLNTPMRGYNSLSGTIYVPSALISTYQTATNWSTIYGEGHVTFAAIEGSEYEL